MRTKSISKKYSVDEIKYRLDLKESEEVFDFTEEIPQQCPRIDQFLQVVYMNNLKN